MDFNGLLSKGLNNLLKLDYLYESADSENKRDIISSMYPEKLISDGFTLRTCRINDVIRLIYNVGEALAKIKTGQMGKNPTCPVMLGYQVSNLD